jgi:hypothetical protein
LEDGDYGEQGKKVGLNSTYGANRLTVERLAQGNLLMELAQFSQVTHNPGSVNVGDEKESEIAKERGEGELPPRAHQHPAT